MSLFEDLIHAFELLFQTSEIWEITFLSLIVSSSAVLLSSTIGIPIGTILGLKKDKENLFLITFLNMSVGLPPVLIGLVVYLIVSRSGPLGDLQLLFTPMGMVLAQFLLTLPIVIALTRSTIKNLPDYLDDTLRSYGASRYQRIYLTISEARFGILIAVVVAFGRAISEVGAIMIVGGNIRFHTRVLTTAIITEVSKGNQELALAMGIILLSVSYSMTLVLTIFQFRARKS